MTNYSLLSKLLQLFHWKSSRIDSIKFAENVEVKFVCIGGDYIYHLLALSGGVLVGGAISWGTAKILKTKKYRNN